MSISGQIAPSGLNGRHANGTVSQPEKPACQPPAQLTWPHPDAALLTQRGVSYPVTYCGSIEVLLPMKDLNFETRTILARECVDRVHRATSGRQNSNGIISPSNSMVSIGSNTGFNISNYISNTPRIDRANTPAAMWISIEQIVILRKNSNNLLFAFQLSLVSFASQGADEFAAYVAFVAKDATVGRACHVFLANSVTAATEIISTMGQAFDLKFRQFMQQPGAAIQENDHLQPLGDRTAVDISTTDYANESAFPMGRSMDSIPALAPVAPSPNHSIVTTASDMVDFPWFHGIINREQAEQRLGQPGDFLVRGSARDARQYVLSAKTTSGSKHILLADAEGRIRTADRNFESIVHLVSYHMTSDLPIISDGTEIFLRYPSVGGGPATVIQS